MSPDNGPVKTRTSPQESWSVASLLSEFQHSGATVQYISEQERPKRIIEQLAPILLEVIKNIVAQAKILGVSMADMWFGELPDGYMIAIPRIQRSMVVQGRIVSITTSTYARAGYIDDDGQWKNQLKEAMLFEIGDDEGGKKNTLGARINMTLYQKSQEHTAWYTGQLTKKTEREKERNKEMNAQKLTNLLAAVREKFPAHVFCQSGNPDLMNQKVQQHTLGDIATMAGIPLFAPSMRHLALAAKVHGEHDSSVQKMMKGLRS